MHTIYRYFLAACALFVIAGGTVHTARGAEEDTGMVRDHAWSGSVVSAPNFTGNIPPGIGIPRALLSGIPEGDYVAVVFFEGLPGCPSKNFVINSFRADEWGQDIRGPGAPYTKAFSSSGGGCMQEFHIDPNKGDEWLWGALSNTSTSSAIADTSGVPAFAICATVSACDPIIPHTKEGAPELPLVTAPTVSNILFLPGIKGSRLYENNPLCLFPSDACRIPLWLPLANAAVPELFMDAQGKSKRNVFVREGDILGSAFGQHFYDSFTHSLDEARSDGGFGDSWDWRAIAYDWRLSLPDIVHTGSKVESRIYFGEEGPEPYILHSLEALASSSPTKKVTIVAHSNGGLVAKALIQSLGDTLAEQLIDTVVFVGVPQSGAPRALGALLYGDAEGIPGIRAVPDFIMSNAHAREFALNSPMAYHLLPSARYFSDIAEPLVQFENSPLLSKERNSYGPTLDSYGELRSYSLATEGGRTVPENHDLEAANVLNSHLLDYAATEHATLDAWQPPAGIDVYELGGYGIDTIAGFDMYEGTRRDGSSKLSYRPRFTQQGDGTVPIKSSLMMNTGSHVHRMWLDLAQGSDSEYDHGTMFESSEIQQIIKDIVHKNLPPSASAHTLEVEPAVIARPRLAFYVHSPVSLKVADENGNETSVSRTEVGHHIPNSTAGTFGEVKYVLVPANEHYGLTLEGEDNGTFTLDMQEVLEGVVRASSTIADVPVTKGSVATLSIDGTLDHTSSLTIDENRDGNADSSIIPQLGGTAFPSVQTHTNSEPESPGRHEERHERSSKPPLVRKYVETALLATVPPTAPFLKARSYVQKIREHKEHSSKPELRIPHVQSEPMKAKSQGITHEPALVRALHRLSAFINDILTFLTEAVGL